MSYNHLNHRFRSAEALTIEPRPIEAANASLPGSEHRAGIVDPTRASLWPLGGGDPVDPISARDGRDVRPQRLQATVQNQFSNIYGRSTRVMQTSRANESSQ